MNHSLGEYLLENIKKNVKDDYLNLNSNQMTIFKVHKCLARKSKFLNIIIEQNEDIDDINLNLDYDDYIIDLVRNHIYDQKIILSTLNYEKLFLISDYLGIETLSEYVLNWIFKFFINFKNSIQIYKLLKASSYRSSLYFDKIKFHLRKNISDIIVDHSINLLDDKEYLEILSDDISQKIILESIKVRIKNKTNRKKLVENFIKEKIFIPGLIDIDIIFSEIFPFLNDLKIELNEKQKLDIIELSNYKKYLKINNKKEYDKYIWATNLKKGMEIEFKKDLFNWTSGFIKNIIIIKGESKYTQKIIIKIAGYNKDEEFTIPEDLFQIDYLHNNTDSWRNQIKINDVINFKIKNKKYNGKIIFKFEDEILIYLNSNYYFKTDIFSECIFKSLNIFEDFDDYNLLITNEDFKKIKSNIEYSEEELINQL